MLFVTPDNWINPINAYGSTGWVDTLDIDKIKNDDQKPKPTVGGDKENKNKFKNKDTMTKTFEHWLNYVKKGKKINESVTDNTTLDKLQAYISENPISDQAHTEEDLHDITMQLFANLDITGAHQDVVDKAKDLVANNISLMYDRSVIGDRNLNWQANLDNKHNDKKHNENNMKNLEVGQCYSIYDIQNNGKILYQFAEYKEERDSKYIFTMINTKIPYEITIDNLDQYMFIKKQPLKKAA